MLGAIAGDIIGSPYEWNNTDDRYFELGRSVDGWHNGKRMTYHPRVTDDTVMTLAVAKWLIKDETHSQYKFSRILQEMCQEHMTKGFSPMMKKWSQSEDPRPFNRDSNDPASRVSPIALMNLPLPEVLALAKISAEATHNHPDAVNGAQAMAQAIWMAKHGRSKEDISFAMKNDFGMDVSIPEADLRALLLGAVKEPIVVNGEETGEYYYRATGKVDYSSANTVTAAVRAFLDGDSYEDVVRRAVALGGDSDTIASMASAIAEPFYGGVPEKIQGICSPALPSELKSIMESYEQIILNKGSRQRTSPVERHNEEAFHIIKGTSGERIFVAPMYKTELINAIKGKFGDDVIIVKPSQMNDTFKQMSVQEKSGTYIEKPRPEIRTIYFQEGEFRTSATVKGQNLPPEEMRKESRQTFYEICDFAKQVKRQLQEAAGYSGEGSIHFEHAYYPEIFHDRIEVWKGDIFAGSVGIDPNSGLLRMDLGGDFGPMEWFGDRTESVFYGLATESIKDSLSWYCLDDGISIYSRDRVSNVQVANEDVAKSNDKELLQQIENIHKSETKGVKVK